MSNTDQGKPAGKSGRRNRKGERGKKAAPQESPAVSPAPVELQSPDQDQPPRPEPVHAESPKVDQPAVDEPVEAVAGPQPAATPSPAEPAPVEAALAEAASIEPAPVEAAPAEAASIQPAPVESAAEPAPVSLQTIANAYRDYTRKSIEEFGSFVEQLSGVRSLDKAMTVQSEFVKRAYETSVAESQKICELHNRLAKQTLDPFKGLTSKSPASHGKP
ncbi:phasin family protein [Bradyrhizobium algeriense]|uniref:phasin family protein n=1 Tax=Bradyrhizobium algeriense TaxID=634784 RepID=UPI000D33BABD|nr:phasin family protein [Bradyrhizobium algeriense]